MVVTGIGMIGFIFDLSLQVIELDVLTKAFWDCILVDLDLDLGHLFKAH